MGQVGFGYLWTGEGIDRAPYGDNNICPLEYQVDATLALFICGHRDQAIRHEKILLPTFQISHFFHTFSPRCTESSTVSYYLHPPDLEVCWKVESEKFLERNFSLRQKFIHSQLLYTHRIWIWGNISGSLTSIIYIQHSSSSNLSKNPQLEEIEMVFKENLFCRVCTLPLWPL